MYISHSFPPEPSTVRFPTELLLWTPLPVGVDCTLSSNCSCHPQVIQSLNLPLLFGAGLAADSPTGFLLPVQGEYLMQMRYYHPAGCYPDLLHPLPHGRAAVALHFVVLDVPDSSLMSQED